MGVPLTIAFAKTEEDRQVMEMMYSQGLFGRPYVLPPDVPAERVEALRKAFMATLGDQDLLAEAEKAGFDVEPLSGEDLQAMIAKLYALPPKVIERAKQSLIYKPQASRDYGPIAIMRMSSANAARLREHRGGCSRTARPASRGTGFGRAVLPRQEHQHLSSARPRAAATIPMPARSAAT